MKRFKVQSGVVEASVTQTQTLPAHHENLAHHQGEEHHHHSHARVSQHAGGHHLLSVEDLSVSFRLYDPDYPGFFGAPKVDVMALDGVNLSVHRGEMLALVGGSGSGKSVLAEALLGIYEPNATVTGRLWYDGQRCDVRRLAHLRRGPVAYAPQSLGSLDPLMKVGRFFSLACGDASSAEATDRIERWLSWFDLDASVLQRYPHELSGGMARRVIVIGALLRVPELLIADEPTPGLDAALAAKLLQALRSVADDDGGVLLITHDLSLALTWADRVAVFHEGRVIEETAAESFRDPTLLREPFSRQLWHAMPAHDFDPDVKDV